MPHRITSAKKTRRNFQQDQRGTATIEFVATLPLLVGALAFAFEFGSFFIAHQSTVNNVRSAARYIARTPDWNAATADTRTIVRTGRFGGTAAPDYLSDATIDITSPAAGQVRIDVRANYPLTLFSFLGSSNSSIPFVVRENVRHVGS